MTEETGKPRFKESNSPWDEVNYEHDKAYLWEKQKYWTDVEDKAKLMTSGLGENKMYSILI